MDMLDEIRDLLADVLQLNDRAKDLQADTPLLGNLPELDSMAVVTIVTTIEDQYGLCIEDDEISAETFETLGSLAAFVESRVNQ
ncbi:MAG TPA: acyl carrier protein [Gammaproteobacteria bacterium]|nr:acyl carrier protein [Gammaproteobacteria bacterium]